MTITFVCHSHLDHKLRLFKKQTRSYQTQQAPQSAKMDDLKAAYYRGCRVTNTEFRSLMNKLILSEDLAEVAAAGAFPGSVPQKPLSALTTLKSSFHMGWVPTEEGFRELMLRVIADEQHAAATKAVSLIFFCHSLNSAPIPTKVKGQEHV